MAECPVCKSTIKATPIGSKTVGITCNCNGNKERYFINSGTVNDTVSEYVDKFNKTMHSSKTPRKIIRVTPAIRTKPISKIEEYFPSQIIPRYIQKQILKEIETNVKLGFKKNSNFCSYRCRKVCHRDGYRKIFWNRIFYY